MIKPRVYADFHNADSRGRVRLNCVGTMEDLAQQQVVLRDGLALTLYSDDLDGKGQLDELVADGEVCYSEEENCWVANINWAAIRHASDVAGSDPNGHDNPPHSTSSEVAPQRPESGAGC
jgi:hypothetical protein